MSIQLAVCPNLCVVLADAAIFVAGDNVLVQKAPCGHCSFALLTGDLETVLVGLICQVIAVSDIVHHDRSKEAHSLFSHSQQLVAVFAKFYSFYGSGLFPGCDILASLCVPESNSVVCCSRSNYSTVWRDVDCPKSALVTSICSQPLPVVRIPGA